VSCQLHAPIVSSRATFTVNVSSLDNFQNIKLYCVSLDVTEHRLLATPAEPSRFPTHGISVRELLNQYLLFPITRREGRICKSRLILKSYYKTHIMNIRVT
jgi:hypothetical protein